MNIGMDSLLVKAGLAVLIFLPPLIYFFREDFFRDRRTRRNKILSKILLVSWVASIPAYVYSEYTDISDSQVMKSNIDILRHQNTSLLLGIDSLMTQNKILKSTIDEYQNENSSLKSSLKETIHRTFRLNELTDGSIAMLTPYKSLQAQCDKALRMYQNGDILSAKLILEVVLERSPNFSQALTLMSFILNEQGDIEEALRLMEKAYQVSKNPEIFKNVEILKRNPGKRLPIKTINE